MYYERQKKKKALKITHNNRLIERKKDDIKSKPQNEEKSKIKFTLNLTLLIHIILEKHPNL